MKINGREIAQKILDDLKLKVQKLDVVPHLAIILIGNDPASKKYIQQKELRAGEIGIKTTFYQYENSIPEKELFDRLNDLNHLSSIQGILIQRPLPNNLDKTKISFAINPKKDVDGFHPKSKFQPPISLAVLEILREINYKGVAEEEGLPTARSSPAERSEKIERALAGGKLLTGPLVVIGKGETGGKPVIQSLEKLGIKPFVIDSKTIDPLTTTKTADVIISAVGKPNIIKPEMIKRGVILISIGLHKGADGKLHGDYEENQVKDIASFYTPTPGGVGPVNVAMLLKNLITTCENFDR